MEWAIWYLLQWSNYWRIEGLSVANIDAKLSTISGVLHILAELDVHYMRKIPHLDGGFLYAHRCLN